MTYMTKFIACLAITAVILVAVSICIYIEGTYSKQFSVILALLGGFVGILGGVIGFISASDSKVES